MDGPIIVVGAGQAGVQLAESLRSEGYTGALTLIGEEPAAPYFRPPLSKAWLLGEADAAAVAIRSADTYARKGIDLVTGVRVDAIDRDARCVRLADGRRLPYAGLALATGARVRRLAVPGAELAGVHVLRTLNDAQALRAGLAAATRVVVVGGGFIGLEVTATARTRGCELIVLEAGTRLMARVVAPLVSDFYAALHAAQGVRLEFGAQLAAVLGREGRVSGVRTADGRELPADLLVVGIGVDPVFELVAACGLACTGGIVVDACGRTADPAIVAAGDCTVRRLPGGGLRRLESVQNAVEQGKAAAAALLGIERPFVASPTFWSDQYSVKLQMVGLSAGHDCVVTRGDVAGQRFSAFYFRAGALLAVDSVNRPQEHLLARRLLDRGVAITPDQAADEQFPLAVPAA